MALGWCLGGAGGAGGVITGQGNCRGGVGGGGKSVVTDSSNDRRPGTDSAITSLYQW